MKQHYRWGVIVTLAASAACNAGASGDGDASTLTAKADTTCIAPTVLTAGDDGSVDEQNGVALSITADGAIQENGKDIPGGEGSSATTYVNGVVWGQDRTSGAWYQYAGGTWTGPSGDPTAGITCPPPQTAPTILTAGDGGSITENNGTTLTITADGNIQENGQDIPGGAGSSAVTYVNGVVWGRDAASGSWYQWTGSTWEGPSDDPTTGTMPPPSNPPPSNPPLPSPPPATGGFYVRNGQIIDPNGNVFIARGIDMGPGDATYDTVISYFPGVNFIRLATLANSGWGVADYQSFVAPFSSHGIVVEIEDHPWPGINALTGQDLQNESNWYAQLASAFVDNPYVWFGTMNEPQAPAYGSAEAVISQQESATYDAIRGVGNNTIIMMELFGGGNPGTIGAGFGFTAETYAPMHNIAWDMHYYGWPSNYSTDQSVVSADLLGSAAGGYGIAAAQTITSADGLVPVVIGEYGNSGNEANGEQVIYAAQSSGFGCVAWFWGGYTIDLALVDNGALTHYGQQVATFIATGDPQ